MNETRINAVNSDYSDISLVSRYEKDKEITEDDPFQSWSFEHNGVNKLNLWISKIKSDQTPITIIDIVDHCDYFKNMLSKINKKQFCIINGEDRYYTIACREKTYAKSMMLLMFLLKN